PSAVNGHDAFRHDAWRTVMNITLDIAWSYEPNEDISVYEDYGLWPAASKVTATGLFPIEYHIKYLSFFEGQGISTHGNQFTMSGSLASNSGQGDPGTHSAGLVAMNAFGARFVYNLSLARTHAQEFWDTPFPSGNGRYYDGC